MPENTPITDAELAVVRQTREYIERFIGPGRGMFALKGKGDGIYSIEECNSDGKRRRVVAGEVEKLYALEFAALHNAFPSVLARLEAAEREREEARKENDFMRLRLAESDKSCVYCALPKADMGACASGFPGCARADDLFHCDELTRRDAQQRREGAAEWFDNHRDYNLSAIEQMEKFTQAAKRLREGGE